jgi:hypothetical protein
MSEKFDIYSKIFFRDVGNFFRHLCELVLRHQMRVSNYFVNSFYSVGGPSSYVTLQLRSTLNFLIYEENLISFLSVYSVHFLSSIYSDTHCTSSQPFCRYCAGILEHSMRVRNSPPGFIGWRNRFLGIDS